MKQTADGYISLNGSQIYYQVQGEGDPLIMIHAGIADLRMWDEQWAELSQRFKVIRYDRPGFGQSPPALGAIDHRQDLTELMQHLGIERAHLLGCSMGGELALDFALAFPDRVSALILVSATPSGFELQGEPPAGVLDMMAAIREGDLDRANALQIQISVDGPCRTAAQVDAAVRDRFLAMNLTALRNGAAMASDASPIEPAAALRMTEVHSPTLVVAGALDHGEILRAASMMAAQIPNAQQTVLPDTGHFPNVEVPEAFNRVVMEFLAGHAHAD